MTYFWKSPPQGGALFVGAIIAPAANHVWVSTRHIYIYIYRYIHIYMYVYPYVYICMFVG